MEKKFTRPEVEIVEIEDVDIIVSSVIDGGEEGEEGGSTIPWPFG